MIQTRSYLLAGGLDLVTGYQAQREGVAIDALNFELLPTGGYRRISGYRAYDGKPETSGVVHDPVPGNDNCRCVFNIDGQVYAIRDNDDSARLYRASPTGWVLVSLGSSIAYADADALFYEGDVVTGGTSGATGTVLRHVFGGGFTDQGNAEGRLVLGSVTGTFVSGEVLSVGATPIATSSTALVPHTIPNGGSYQVRIYNFFGRSDTRRAYVVSGHAPAFEFDGSVFCPITPKGESQFPERVAVHKEHLFLSYPRGAIVSSATANPLSFSVLEGAIEIGVGDTITDMRPLAGGVLMIGCRYKVEMLYGNNSSNWEKQFFVDHGVRRDTVSEIGGRVLALDDRGVQEIRTTQAYGDFSANSVSYSITDRVINLLRSQGPPVSVTSKNNNAYRIFWGRNGFYFTYNGPKFVGVMPVAFEHPVLMTSEGEDFAGNELVLFATSGGYVMQMDSTNYFNGLPILSRLQLAFAYQGAETRKKHYKKAVINARVVGEDAPLMGRALYDFDRSVSHIFEPSIIDSSETGFWGDADWNFFRWASPANSEAVIDIDGGGENISIAITHAGIENTQFTLYGVTLHFSYRRLNR